MRASACPGNPDNRFSNSPAQGISRRLVDKWSALLHPERDGYAPWKHVSNVRQRLLLYHAVSGWLYVLSIVSSI